MIKIEMNRLQLNEMISTPSDQHQIWPINIHQLWHHVTQTYFLLLLFPQCKSHFCFMLFDFLKKLDRLVFRTSDWHREADFILHYHVRGGRLFTD